MPSLRKLREHYHLSGHRVQNSMHSFTVLHVCKILWVVCLLSVAIPGMRFLSLFIKLISMNDNRRV